MTRRGRGNEEAVTAVQPEIIGLRGAHGRWGLATAMRYPISYACFVFVSALDIMLTWRILEEGGTEVNPIARGVIDSWGLPGAIGFKFSLMLFVIVVCEAAGRSRDRLGRGLALVSVGISALPVTYSLGLLVYHILIVRGGLA